MPKLPIDYVNTCSLQAEMEQHARLGATKPGGDEPATLKAWGAGPDHVSTPTTTSTPPQSSTTPSTPKPPNNLCRFFASEKGCRRGKECKYPHTWTCLTKKCLNCGGQGHKAKECKAPGGGSGGSKGGQRGGPVGASDTGATSSTSPTSEPTRRVNFDVGEIQVDSIKTVPVFKPVVAALGCCGYGAVENDRVTKHALLDSGATHALRHPKDQGEWNHARSVGVQLAGDAVALMKQNDSGTLLSTDEMSQVIVPLGKVFTSLGYRLIWTASSCELVAQKVTCCRSR